LSSAVSKKIAQLKEREDFLSGLVAHHGDALKKYLARKLDNPEDAAEVAQEAYLRLQRIEQPQTLDNARAFLFQVATNLAVDQLRRRQLHQRYLSSERNPLLEGELPDPNGDGAPPEQILVAKEKLNAIYAAIEELPFKTRQAFLMHRRNGLSYSEIAHQLDVSVSSVEKYILHALRHCRERLAAHYPPEKTG
jgi:RNA polymerase sigma factor (sigma-70 family)